MPGSVELSRVLNPRTPIPSIVYLWLPSALCFWPVLKQTESLTVWVPVCFSRRWVLAVRYGLKILHIYAQEAHSIVAGKCITSSPERWFYFPHNVHQPHLHLIHCAPMQILKGDLFIQPYWFACQQMRSVTIINDFCQPAFPLNRLQCPQIITAAWFATFKGAVD